MQRTIRFSAIAAITWLLSVAVLISVANFDVAQARRAAALGCGKELQKLCSGAPVLANNMLECLQKTKKNFPQDALNGPTMLCAAVIGMQCSIAKPSRRVKAIFSDA